MGAFVIVVVQLTFYDFVFVLLLMLWCGRDGVGGCCCVVSVWGFWVYVC